MHLDASVGTPLETKSLYVMAAVLSSKSSLKPEPLGELWVVSSCSSGLALKHCLQKNFWLLQPSISALFPRSKSGTSCFLKPLHRQRGSSL